MRKQNCFSPLSRRHFLLGSASVVGSVSLLASNTDPQGVDTAAPRGKQRNLLNNACSPEKLSFWGVPAHLYIQKADLGKTSGRLKLTISAG